MFSDALIERIEKTQNPSVVGLDPILDYIPQTIVKNAFTSKGITGEGAAEAIWEFNKELIDSIHDVVPAVKLQAAYYELYGVFGYSVLKKTMQYAQKKGMLVIIDGKRNDIGSTAQAYSSAYLGKTVLTDDVAEAFFDADALTVNGYLGFDGIKPFIDDCINYHKGIFILVKTSNKSSGQLQDLVTQEGKTVFEHMAELVNEWGEGLIGKRGYSSIGAVVGATYPKQAAQLRKIMKKTYILVPGYGAQGGTANDAVKSFNEDKLGGIVNASRSIMCAYKADLWKEKFTPENFAAAARAEVVRMKDDLNLALNEKG
jgi:orotidine-5'-phosphate decarboxylase